MYKMCIGDSRIRNTYLHFVYKSTQGYFKVLQIHLPNNLKTVVKLAPSQ